MARARNIKPGFFKDDMLADIEPIGRLLLAGLPTIADREGRLPDRPRWIKAETLPYDDVDVEELLRALTVRNFIVRYTVDGRRLIQIADWNRDQNPHVREPKSTLPAPGEHQTSTVLEPAKPETSMEPARRIPLPPSLIPDSVTSGPVRALGAPGADTGDPAEAFPEEGHDKPPLGRRSPRPTKKEIGPTEDEWILYAAATWPEWPRNDAEAAWSYYEARGWKGFTNWKACAKTCYHRWAGNGGARGKGAVAPAVGARSVPSESSSLSDALDPRFPSEILATDEQRRKALP